MLWPPELLSLSLYWLFVCFGMCSRKSLLKDPQALDSHGQAVVVLELQPEPEYDQELGLRAWNPFHPSTTHSYLLGSLWPSASFRVT